MPRGKNTNVYLSCQNKVTDRKHGGDTCKMQNYKTRINKRTLGTKKLEMNKFCPKCNDHTPHVSGSEIKHSS